MMGLAIDLLWLLIGVIIFCAVVWLVIYGINQFVYSIPERVVQAIWFVVLLLIIIAVLTMLAGGSGLRGPSFLKGSRSGIELPVVTASAPTPTGHLQSVLSRGTG